MPNLDLRTVTGELPPIMLGQVDIGLADEDTEPLLMVLTNRDTLDLSEIRVSTAGPGASAVQLARDLEGPGEWTDGEIIALAGVLPPNRSCQFWARAVASDDVAVGDQSFEFVVKSVAVGA